MRAAEILDAVSLSCALYDAGFDAMTAPDVSHALELLRTADLRNQKVVAALLEGPAQQA